MPPPPPPPGTDERSLLIDSAALQNFNRVHADQKILSDREMLFNPLSVLRYFEKRKIELQSCLIFDRGL